MGFRFDNPAQASDLPATYAYGCLWLCLWDCPSLRITSYAYGYAHGVALSLRVTSYAYGYAYGMAPASELPAMPMAMNMGLPQPQSYQLCLWLCLWGLTLSYTITLQSSNMEQPPKNT